MARKPKKKKANSQAVVFDQPDPTLREAAKTLAATGAKTRSETDIAHWYITVLKFNVPFDTPLSTVRQGTNINFGLAQDCNAYPNFAADRLNLQKSDVSTANSVGQFYQDILSRYIKNGWSLTS